MSLSISILMLKPLRLPFLGFSGTFHWITPSYSHLAVQLDCILLSRFVWSLGSYWASINGETKDGANSIQEWYRWHQHSTTSDFPSQQNESIKSGLTVSLRLQRGSTLHLWIHRKTPCPSCNHASLDSVPNYKYILAFHSSYILLTWTHDCYYIIHNMILNNFQSRFKQKCVTLGLYYLWA